MEVNGHTIYGEHHEWLQNEPFPCATLKVTGPTELHLTLEIQHLWNVKGSMMVGSIAASALVSTEADTDQGRSLEKTTMLAEEVLASCE